MTRRASSERLNGLFLFGFVVTIGTVRAGTATRASAGTAAPFSLFYNASHRKENAKGNNNQYYHIGGGHIIILPNLKTKNAHTHATAHWNITTPTVCIFEPSSRRMEATAATQGV